MVTHYTCTFIYTFVASIMILMIHLPSILLLLFAPCCKTLAHSAGKYPRLIYNVFLCHFGYEIG